MCTGWWVQTLMSNILAVSSATLMETVWSSNLLCPNSNKCEHQELAHKNFPSNSHGNASWFQCAISILTAHMQSQNVPNRWLWSMIKQPVSYPTCSTYFMKTWTFLLYPVPNHLFILFFATPPPKWNMSSQLTGPINNKPFSYHNGQQLDTR
jgi:hypothetical protein